MRGGLSPIEARRLVGHADEVQPCPTKRAERISRIILLVVFIAAFMGMCAATQAADRYPPGQYAIWLFHAAAPHENPDMVRIYKISGDFADRATCLQVLSSVVTKARGAVARCLPANQ